MRRKNKLTQNQKLFKKQIDRIKRAVRRLEKQGYTFTTPKADLIPEMPKRVTKKAIEKLRKITPEILRYRTVVLSERGIESGIEYQKRIRQEGARKAAIKRKQARDEREELRQGFMNQYIRNIREEFNSFPSSIADKLLSWLDRMIAEYGKEAAIKMFENMPMEFYDYLYQKGYDSDRAVREYTSALLNYLPLNEQERKGLEDAYDDASLECVDWDEY